MNELIAALGGPGHPLLDATVDLILERYRDLLRRGAVLVDPGDHGDNVRALFYVEHAIQDAHVDGAGNRRIVSRQLQFVEIDASGAARIAGSAPYLDYRPLAEDERAVVEPMLAETWLGQDLEGKALGYAVAELVPGHDDEVRHRKEEQVARTRAAVQDRLTKEIIYWDHRAEELRLQEQAGRTPRLNSTRARQRADDLTARLDRRLNELDLERQLAPLPPHLVGGALVVPIGLIERLKNQGPTESNGITRETARVEALAMAAVMEQERSLGFEPRDVSAARCGYDVESKISGTGRLRFLEVKGRHADATTVTITKNEILTALNQPDDFILAIVKINGDVAGLPLYLRHPFQREPDFGVTAVDYDIRKLAERAEVYEV